MFPLSPIEETRRVSGGVETFPRPARRSTGLGVRCAAEDKGDKAAEKVKIVDGANSPPGGVNLSGSDTELEEATKKWGLEYGIFKAFTSKGDNGAPKSDGAKGLLARYGSAYLLTSISLSLVSFSLCYVLVDSGVDVAALLAKVGIQVDSDSSMEQVGTVALAYAAHKAASPIRFPPTVALTPIVARWMGKNMDESGDADAKK
eukprot:jgi/Mesvir1/20929/Mv08000-RA.1